MTAANRATKITKLQTLLKKAYKPAIASDNRPLIEHLLYACLLENAPYELADEALARLEQDYFDWNEVRVTTITELSEVLSQLPDPAAAAIRLKKNLHGLFESFYSFDLEELRKLNLGKAVEKFEALPAMTPFVLAYMIQHGLGGHAIPLDSAALRFFWLADIINENELKANRVTGLERAVPKTKAVEFSSLLHQAAVALNMDPTDATARGIVLALNPDLDQKVADHVAAVKERRSAKAKAKAAALEMDAEDAEDQPTKSGKATSKGKKTGAEAASDAATAKKADPSAEPKKKTSKPGATKADAEKKSSADKKAGSEKKASLDKQSGDDKPIGGGKKSASKKPSAGPESEPKKAAKTNAPASKGAAAKKGSDEKSSTGKPSGKTSSKKITKRKPR